MGEHIEEVTFHDYWGDDREVRTWKELVRFIDVEVEGTAIVNGWQFAASLEYTDKGNIISGVEGIEIPERYYKCAPWCEHCKTARDRKYSFIVRNTESGEFKQVGKACLKDFTGGLSATDAANWERGVVMIATPSRSAAATPARRCAASATAWNGLLSSALSGRQR